MMFAGTMIAPGIAVGPAVIWERAAEQVTERRIAADAVATEQQRFELALSRTRSDLEKMANRVAATVGGSAAAIFTAHQVMADDPALLGAVRQRIAGENLSAESAVAITIQEHVRRISSLENSYLAARAEDIRDLGARLLANLRREGGQLPPQLDRPSILIADLTAADVVLLDRTHVLALVLVQSGPTSHAALLASTLGVPVVCRVTSLPGKVRDQDMVVIDGNHGHVIVHPTQLALREYHTRQEIFRHFSGELAGLRDAPAVTRCGRSVRLTANIGLQQEIPLALAQGAEGVGLVRTEYFFLGHAQPPDEDEQYRFYSTIVQALQPRPVTFRTLDMGGDKGTIGPAFPEANPMLGCRGIRLLHEYRDVFVSQLRALLRASVHGPTHIMFPLVTSLTEFQDTMRVVDEVKRDLQAAAVPFDPQVRFGCMIETPAAATIPDILASEAEFFSIGSNDLIQYTMAADRTNPRVAHLYEPLHLAVLRMMRAIIRAARRGKRPVSLCGEMAADPIYTLILLGLGVDELSMNPVMIPAIKQIIRNVTWAEARAVARGVLRERRAKDVQTFLEKMMASRFPQVMSMYGRDGEEPAADSGP